MLEYENRLWSAGYKFVAGVDEAGRGPLAGPVYAAAVIFKEGTVIEGINDSKKLSEKKREYLYDVIIEKALAYKIVSVDAAEIDKINILNASLKAFSLAVDGLSQKPDYVLFDGNRAPQMTIPFEAVVKGDAKVQAIAAASVLAKVARDRYITEMDKIYPEYGFAGHKGYPTKEHKAAVEKYGPSPIHRLTFRGVSEHVK
ncbi:MAG: ribonuclease HII [Ruminococcaceae bacterium]|nr:ribonuclease HII [Oscillospiraceae bacterium]